MEPTFITTSWQKIKEWSLGNALNVHSFGTSCCALEIQAASGPRYDWERFGFLEENNIAEADLLIIAGPVTVRLEERVKEIYKQMREPRFVVSVGSCANTGGMFIGKSTTVIMGVDKILPIDLFVPGCPPRPEAIIHALLQLQKKIFAGSKIAKEKKNYA